LIEVVKTNCIINNDWIDEIEKGLTPIEKAINEERQFITTNGEVVPIEKVKHVSRDSVEHLAKHSNLLTRVTEGEDLIPDQLYTVERLSDYSVYENRFLYMLLCYLRDFISYRYDKILDLMNTYSGKMVMKKTVLTQSGKTVFEIKLDEKRRNDEYLKAHNPAKEQLDRIDLLLKSVMVFLSSPLMKLVSQAPMLKPPIVETNVLKMDLNFKGAMELYYFVVAYEGDGFTIEQEVKKLSPFGEVEGDEFAEVAALSSFLTYEYGLGIASDLKANYEAEEKARAQREEQLHLEQLERLRKRIKESGESPEEYMLQLEQRNRKLEKTSAQLVAAQAQIEKLNEEIAKLNEEIASLNKNIEELNATIEDLHQQMIEMEEAYKKQIEDLKDEYENKIAELNEQHAQEIARLNEEHQAEITKLYEEHSKEISRLNAEHAEEVARLNEEHEQAINDLNAQHEQTIANLNSEHEQAIASLNAEHESEMQRAEEKFGQERDALNGEIASLNQKLADDSAAYEERIASGDRATADALSKLDDAERRYRDMENQKLLLDAKLNTLKHEHGLFKNGEEFTSQESFEEIERQYAVFKAFFNDQWKATKKRIRKEVLSSNKADKSGGENK
jgi:hypothetical protein